MSDLVRKGGEKKRKFFTTFDIKGGISSTIRGVIVSPYGPDRKQM